MRRIVFAALALVVAPAIGGWITPAFAEYPERPLTIVEGFPAGGMVDIVVRPRAETMKKKFPRGIATPRC